MTETPPPWDIYIDERKVPNSHALGFLEVPNTASFQHKLFRCRESPMGRAGSVETREIHWQRLHRGVLPVAMHWIDRVFQHRGVAFRRVPWPTTATKQLIILNYLRLFAERKQLQPVHDVVVFLDYDTDHARSKIQNQIRELGQVRRCYHVDSRRNDCIQCADLLLGAVSYLKDNPSTPLVSTSLLDRYLAGDQLRDSECKQVLAADLAQRMESNQNCVYDLDEL